MVCLNLNHKISVFNSELTELVPVFTIRPAFPTYVKKVNTSFKNVHRIRFYLEFLQFRQHGNVSIIKMWSLNDNMIERLHKEIELEIERV
jgi:hypothetical protein